MPTLARCGLAFNLTIVNPSCILWGLHSLALHDLLVILDQEYVGLADVYWAAETQGFVS